MTADLTGVVDALRAAEGFEPLPCDGQGHPIEGALACMHLRCALPSPTREERLAVLAPLVRRAGFVMAALVDRRDLYSISWKPGRREADPAAALARLEALLRDPGAWASDAVPDRRGRT